VTSPQDAPQKTEDRDPEEGPELARLVALLQSLPDPAPAEGLVERVMTEVRRREARPRVLRVAFRTISQPGMATALAAGLACVAVFSAVGGGFSPGETPTPHKLVPSIARPIGSAGDTLVRSPSSRTVIADPVAFFVDDVPSEALTRAGTFPVATGSDLLTKRLDRQLNRLLLDPRAFYRQVERHGKGDLVISRLANRAAERGDAIGIALRLRETEPRDPITNRFVAEFFGAVLERSVPQH
jgi:hypothetical protein